jgi:RNA polymerase sigma-70 factor (ECF subfamily)
MIGGIASLWEASVSVEAEVAQLRRGDLDALTALIARYQNRLYRYLLRLVHQPAEAEDLFQQTWLRVAEKIRAFDANRNFDTWLFTLARNLAIDHLRRIRPESLDEPASRNAEAETFAARLVSNEPAALDRVLAHERSDRVAGSLAELPMIYREVLTLRFEEEMKIEEIAQALGIPLSTVKSRLRRSLEQLRSRLESSGMEGDWQ